eukprot:TRINITY_DN17052_c0_g1_i1.p1 TRINITY_DN17052_c0_g1~~TRINITY_DN17052_c0_g1_i1.p1  ORF type:complete len:863 (-),score=240.53 TRINITY_DN17052_c0_g1_i1:65-2653(-)
MAVQSGGRQAAARPGSAGRGRAGAPKFQVGARIEYWSKSYNEWIPATIGAVRSDGSLRLLHEDGTVMKEAADASACRPSELPSGRSGGSSEVLRGEETPARVQRLNSHGSIGGSTPKRSSVPEMRSPQGGHPRGSPRSSVPASPTSNGGGPPRLPGGRQPSSRSSAQLPPAAVGGEKHLPMCRQPSNGGRKMDGSPTSEEHKLFVGDRARIRETGREGAVMFVGVPSLSNNHAEVVGLRLDEKRSKSDCDGKAPNGERLFRCPAGYGIILPSRDVELVKSEDPDGYRSVPAPAEKLELESTLQTLVGLANVKQQLAKVRQLVEVQKKREGLGVHGAGKPLHFGFRGSRGTGMTSVAKLLSHLLRDLEVCTSGQLVEICRQDVVASCESSSQLERQLTKLWKAASGGVLLVNDAQLFQEKNERGRDDIGTEACEWINKQVQSMAQKCSGEGATSCFPQDVVVILAQPQDAVLPEALQRLQLIGVEFPDYSDEELAEILAKLVDKRGFLFAEDLSSERLLVHIRDAVRSSDAQAASVKNVNMLQRLLEEAISRQTERVFDSGTITLKGLTTLAEEDFKDNLSPGRDEAIQAALSKLDNVIGLKAVKSFVHSLYAQLKTEIERREAGVAAGAGGAGTLHMIFSGNPGTGKTTVARIVAELLAAMGLLRKGHLVEADRGTLVAGYSGQTALKTRQVVESAMGGVLFVDEAYALVSEDGKDAFGHEALDTLIKMIEDRRSDLVVIFAGYNEEMDRLVSSNPGVRSRFPVKVQFEDYTEEELLQIADKMLLDDCLVLSQGATQALSKLLKSTVLAAGKSGRESGNGRAVRNILEKAKRNMAVRIQELAESERKRSKAILCTLEAADIK